MTEKDIVKTYLAAFYREHKELDVIEGLLAEDFVFVGPMATFHGREPFMKFIREIGPQKNQIEIHKIVADAGEVAVFHDFRSETPVIGPLPFAEWYSLQGGKITSLRLYFDAREFAPLLQDQMPGEKGATEKEGQSKPEKTD